ncbi:TonB-dependent receptor plug domain-containing protein [Sphingobium terrigena]|nr:TonB-dependent receptor plug domain-containing protein [Sphingobium terrigena]
MRLALALTGCVSMMSLATAANAQAGSLVETGNRQAPANADATGSANEIIVTASKQGEQTLQKSPLAIQAFSGEALALKGVKDNGELIALIPGAAPLEQVGSLLRAYSLRGSGAGGAVGDPLIGYYLDDAPFAIPNIGFAPPVRFLDLDRIEVLRGPQGTLYGQGSMGGTIIYHTRDPNLRRAEAQFDTNLSTTREAGGLNYGIAGAVSVPIVKDTLALRVSGGYDHRAGYVDVYSGAAYWGAAGQGCQLHQQQRRPRDIAVETL